MQARNTYDRSAILGGYIGTSGTGLGSPIKEDEEFRDNDDEDYPEDDEPEVHHPADIKSSSK